MKKGEILELEICDLAFGGKGIAKVENKIIFIDGALPGQTISAKISKNKKNYSEAKLLQILEKSPAEIETNFQETPGAPWLNLPINLQHSYKKKQVFDLFKKFAKFDLEKVFDEFLSSPEIWNYRNKMEFSFGVTEEKFNEKKNIWEHFGFGLGSKKRGQFWLVENLEKASGIFDEEFENLLPKIREFLERTDLKVYNQRTNKGFFRQLVVRKSVTENKFLINLITTSQNKNYFNEQDFCSFLNKNLDQKLSGIFWTISDSLNDSSQNYNSRKILFGKEKIIEKINDLEFEISLDSFFQTNTKSAENLYKKIIQYVDLKSGKDCLDLFCGTGTIGQIISKKFPKNKIIGIEIVESAVKNAQENSQKNNLNNVQFICSDVNKFLVQRDLLKNINTVILDPPRSGISPKSLKKILEFSPENLVYISCNPATMARDSELILANNYQLKKISLIDQFPHTSHIECIAKFIKP